MNDEIPGSGGSEQDATQSEVDVLNDETETQNEEKEETETTESETETESESEDESKEDTDSESDSDDEDLSDVEDEEEEESAAESDEEITRPSWQTIKKEYPKLAKDKDFKALYFRDKAMSEVFSTVDDARDAATKASAFEEYDIALVNGDVGKIVSTLNKDVLTKFSERILPALFSVDKQFFQIATQPIVIDLLNNAYEYAEKAKDNNLRLSVRHLSNFLTGSPDVPRRQIPVSETPEVKREIERLRNERITSFRNQEKTFLVSADSAVLKRVERLIEDNLDPDNKLSAFAKSAIKDRTLADVKKALQSDVGLTEKVKSIHKQAARDGFDDRYKSRIIAASLDRAKKVIPGIRNRHKFAALGKQAPKGDKNKITPGTQTESIRTTGSAKDVTSIKQLDTRKMTEADFLAGKVVLKK